MSSRAKTKSIGVFDSGFGGLSILKEVIKALPQYRYVYLGDTARTPYGTRSMDTVYRFTTQAINFLFEKDCELILIACNTASATALRKIQQEYLPTRYPNQRRVLGVIVPTLEEAVEKTKTHRIGVLATEGTVASGTFARELRKLDPKAKVFQQACPLLVPFIEEGAHKSKAAELIVREYLKPLLAKRIDTLILGCTHYGHIEALIRKNIPKNIQIISEGKLVAKKLKDYLRRHPEVESKLARGARTTFYSTDLTERFKKLGTRFLGQPINPKRAELE